MNRLLFIVFILSNALTAQVKISGKVLTVENKPLEFAEVTLFSNESILVGNQVTNEKGEFVLESKKGSYKLQISQFSSILYTKGIELDSNLELEPIKVEIPNQLESVTISKKKALVERKIDRLVFNVENTISTAGGDALDALKITPGIQIQNENITIAGKNTVRVLIDDKLIELSQEELTNLLKSIPSENIKSIEVITTPPAKYEALGGSGLVNIRLKKAKNDSWNLSLGAGYLRRKIHGEGSLTSNFIYNKNKFGMSASLNYRDGTTDVEQNDYIYFSDGLWNANNPLKRDYRRINGILSMQYVATPKWTFGYQYLTNLNKTDSNANRNLLVHDYNTNEVLQHVKSDGSASLKPTLHSINVFNEIKLDSVGKKIILNSDYFKYTNNDVRPYEGTSIINDPYSIQYFKGINGNNQNINNFSNKIDVELPIEWANLSFGGKISNSKSTNSISAFNSGLVNNPVTELPLTYNEFRYNENIQAAYISGNKKIYGKFESQIGLRFEATQTESYDGNLNQTVDNSYTKFFPSVNISYSPRANSTYRFNYSKRIERPTFAQLNPNITYINPFQTIQGNPFLQPAFIDNFELIYSYRKLETKLYYSKENNLFGQIAIPDPDTNYVHLVNKNNFNIDRYGISEIFVFSKFKWWTSNNAFDLNYAVSESISTSTPGKNGLNSRMSTNNDFALNESKTLLFNFNFQYTFPETLGIIKFKSSSTTSLTAQYLLLNKDLRISLKANDIFGTERLRFSSTVNGVYQESNYYFDARFIQLSVNYRLGNKKAKIESRKAGNEEERMRTGT